MIDIPKEFEKEDVLKYIFKILLYVDIYSIIWMLLELVIYGEVQSRTVDSIMMILFAITNVKFKKGEIE